MVPPGAGEVARRCSLPRPAGPHLERRRRRLPVEPTAVAISSDGGHFFEVRPFSTREVVFGDRRHIGESYHHVGSARGGLPPRADQSGYPQKYLDRLGPPSGKGR